MLGVDRHQRTKADGYLVAIDARDVAGQFHVLPDHCLRGRIDNRMRERIGRDRHAYPIGRYPTAHNRRDGDLIAYFDITPSHDLSRRRIAGAG